LIDILVAQTQALSLSNFIVRQHLRVVEKYQDVHSWNALNDLDIREIFTHIAPLVNEIDKDELAKRFDAMMLDLQLFAHLGDQRQVGLIKQVSAIAGQLLKKGAVPMVARKMDTLRELHAGAWAGEAGVLDLERIREELRDLLKFLDKNTQPLVYTRFEDSFEGTVTEHTLLYNANNLEAYRRKVQQYILAHEHHLVIHKLKTNEPVTRGELAELERMLFEQGVIGSKEAFIQAYGDQPLGRFIRSIIGLDVNAAKLAFSGLLQVGNLNSQQIRFIDTIIHFFTAKGIVEPSKLFESPFTDINANGMLGVFDEKMSARIIDLVEGVNRNAEVA
jgi:type I restriction enzyme, R subunit